MLFSQNILGKIFALDPSVGRTQTVQKTVPELPEGQIVRGEIIAGQNLR